MNTMPKISYTPLPDGEFYLTKDEKSITLYMEPFVNDSNCLVWKRFNFMRWNIYGAYMQV